MAVFSLTVVEPVHRYHAYMDQWEAEIDTAHFFEREVGEYKISQRCKNLYLLFHSQDLAYFEQVMPMTLND